MTQENAVQVIEPITNLALVAVEIFTPEGVEKILSDIKAKVAEHKPDLSTVTSRKAIASNAHKVSRSKVLLDDLGKSLNEQKRAEIGIVDAERKKLRDALDLLRDETRAPLDAWEEAEEKRLAAEKLAKEIEDAHAAALVEDAMITQAKELEALKAEVARVEAERIAKEAAELAEKLATEEAARVEAARIANEERIRKEAETAATLKAEQEAAAAVAEAERKAAEAVEWAAETERQRVLGERKAEQDRVAAEERAKAEQITAVAAAEEKARKEAEAKEFVRQVAESKAAAEAETARREAERKAADVEHRRTVNKEAMAALVAAGLEEVQAKAVLTAIIGGLVPRVTVNY